MLQRAVQVTATGYRGMRAKIYIRVSSIRGRKELISPEIQEAAARSKAEQEGIDVIDVVFDLDQSGRDFAKRKIEDIIDEVRRGQFEVVLLWKWSRFGRNLLESLKYLEELRTVGGIALSATEPGDSVTTMGKFSRNQMLSIAELQSDMIGDGWRDVHEYRLSIGLPHNGGDRFGYVNVDGAYFPEPIRGDALAEVFEAYVHDESFRLVADDMARAGIRAPNGDIMGTDRWLRILDSGFGAGRIRRRKPGATSRRFDQWDWHPGAHKAVIEEDIWQAFYDKRMASVGQKRSSTKAKYSLSGVLWCGRCKKFMMTATKNGSGKVQFRCSGINTKQCQGVSILLSSAEEGVLEWLERRAQKLETIEELAREEAAREKTNTEIEKLKKKVDDLDARIIRLLDLYESGGLDKDEYQKRKAEREIERSKARQRLTELGANDPKPIRLPAGFFKDLRDAWPRLSHDRKRQAIRKVIDRVYVYGRNHDGEKIEVEPKQFAA